MNLLTVVFFVLFVNSLGFAPLLAGGFGAPASTASPQQQQQQQQPPASTNTSTTGTSGAQTQSNRPNPLTNTQSSNYFSQMMNMMANNTLVHFVCVFCSDIC